MVSMTGFANCEINENDLKILMEIHGVNSRFLEININIPPGLSSIEKKIREYISLECYRGKIDVFIRIWDHSIPVKIKVNKETAKAYKSAINMLAKDLKIRDKIDLNLLVNLDGVLEIEKNTDNNMYWNYIEPAFKQTVNVFNESRNKEGKLTEADIMKHICIIEAALETVKQHATLLENSIKENLKTRFFELLGDKVDENRILAETAILLMKATISEEINRLGIHLNEFREEAANNKHPGRKLDFLSQEINREINTIGSKSTIVAVSHAVVDMKDALENIREQLRNVE